MKEIVEVLRETGLKIDRLTTKVIREELGEDIKYFGAVISISKFKILALTNQKPNGVKYRVLVENTGLAKSTLSITINELCDIGMLTKEVRETPSETYIKITDLGRKFSNVYTNVENRLQSKLFKDLNVYDINALRKLLNCIENRF